MLPTALFICTLKGPDLPNLCFVADYAAVLPLHLPMLSGCSEASAYHVALQSVHTVLHLRPMNGIKTHCACHTRRSCPAHWYKQSTSCKQLLPNCAQWHLHPQPLPLSVWSHACCFEPVQLSRLLQKKVQSGTKSACHVQHQMILFACYRAIAFVVPHMQPT